MSIPPSDVLIQSLFFKSLINPVTEFELNELVYPDIFLNALNLL